jgi:hypothetical protein
MSSGSTYILEGGSAQSQLSSNTGKKVEVTGTLDSSMSGSSSATPSGSTAGAAGSTAGSTAAGTTGAAGAGSTGSASGSMSGAQHLRVSSVRVIGDSCR